MTFTENIKLSTFLAIKVQLEDVITVQEGKTINQKYNAEIVGVEEQLELF